MRKRDKTKELTRGHERDLFHEERSAKMTEMIDRLLLMFVITALLTIVFITCEPLRQFLMEGGK